MCLQPRFSSFFFRPQTLTSLSFVASCAAWMHYISFEALDLLAFDFCSIKSISTFKVLIIPTQCTSILCNSSVVGTCIQTFIVVAFEQTFMRIYNWQTSPTEFHLTNNMRKRRKYRYSARNRRHHIGQIWSYSTKKSLAFRILGR